MENKDQQQKVDEKINRKNIQIKIKNDDVAAGSYSNSFAITFNENEFLIDFIMMQPQAKLGLVTDRIVMTPRKAAELAKALSDAVNTFENMHKPVKSASGNIQ
jgi:hypothetical protein